MSLTRAQGLTEQDPGYQVRGLPAMAPSRDPGVSRVKRTSPINRTCNLEDITQRSPIHHWHTVETAPDWKRREAIIVEEREKRCDGILVAVRLVTTIRNWFF